MLIDLENANLLEGGVDYALWYENWTLLVRLGEEYSEKRTTKRWAAVAPSEYRGLLQELKIGHCFARYMPFPQAPVCDIHPPLPPSEGGHIFIGRSHKWLGSSSPNNLRSTGAGIAGVNPRKD